MIMGEINIVHLHVRHKRYHTGIDRYLEMYSNGIKSEAYSDIRVHRIYIVDDRDIIFPRIRFTEEGTLHALIPMVYDNLLVSLDVFWKRRSMKIVVDMVKPYLQRLSNLVFQSHNLYLSVLAEELKNKLGGKIIMHLHCLPWKFTYNENEELYNKLHRLYEAGNFKEFNELEDSKIDYSVPDKIICLSDAAKGYLMNTKGVPEDKIDIIMNGLAPADNDNPLRKGDVKILYVGKISKDKGSYKMLDILDSVCRRGYDFEVVMAGAVGAVDKTRLCSMYGRLKLTFLNQIPYSELAELYRTCTLGILPSIHEQCSYVGIEMSMFGVPLVVSEVDALKEMFKDNETALLVPLLFDPDLGLDFDREIFADRVIRLIENDKLRRYLGENAQKAYRESFTLNGMIERTVDLYKQIV